MEFCFGVVWSVLVVSGLGGNGKSDLAWLVVELTSGKWRFLFESEIRMLFPLSFFFSEKGAEGDSYDSSCSSFRQRWWNWGIRACTRGCMLA